MDQHWLTIVIVLLIIGIVADGVRRMYKARRDSIKMSLRPMPQDDEDAEAGLDDEYGSEFPNGGARPTDRQIDPERIQQVRSKYDFSSDIPAWRDKVADKIAEHTGMKRSEESTSSADRIEPSVDHDIDSLMADPLIDGIDEERVYDSDDGDYELPSYRENVQGDDVEYEADKEPYDEDVYENEYEEDVLEKVAPTAEKRDEVREPVQASLNLEDSVPMLMDSLGDDDSDVACAQEIRPIANHIESTSAVVEKPVETHSANKPRYESKYVDHAKQAADKPVAESKEPQKEPQDVLVIHVKAAKNEYFYGSDLLELILDNGMRFGEMDIFHRHAGEEGEGAILFSMANMVKPGTFDLHNFEEFSTVGLSFFLPLPTELDNNMAAFDMMLDTAKDIADNLSGELNDEHRSILTKQTIEHYRERIRDFTRRQQLEKNK